jgi:hypothetical protein
MDIKRLQQLAGILKEDINPYEDEKINITDKDIYDIAYSIIKTEYESRKREWEASPSPKRRTGPIVPTMGLSIRDRLRDLIVGRVGHGKLEDNDIENWMIDEYERVDSIIEKVRQDIRAGK